MAEFTEIIKIKNRMCAGGLCRDCPLDMESNGYIIICDDLMNVHPEEFERICLEWAKENPEISNKDKLYQAVKEIFGEKIASRIKDTIIGDSCIYIDCPEAHTDCFDCKNKGFWDKPYVESKKCE